MRNRETWKTCAAQRGTALPVVLILGVVIALLTGGALAVSRLEGLVTVNHKNDLHALQAAEAGLIHAVEIIPWGIEFDRELAGLDGDPGTVSDNGRLQGFPHDFPENASPARCDVLLRDDRPAIDGNADPYDDANQRIIVTATGFAPANARKTVEGYVARNGFFRPPGAVHLPGPEVDTNFDGDSFHIDGNDTNPNGTPGPMDAVNGITTTDQEVEDEIVEKALGDSQKDNVVGHGEFPSVGRVYPPFSVDALANEILSSFPHTVLGAKVYGGRVVLGTPQAPQITWLTNKEVRLAGSASGAGVLIVDGALTITGTFDFQGLVIARAGIEVTVHGDATIFGSLMTKESFTADDDAEFDIRGNASVFYSSQALKTVEDLLEGLGRNPLPRKALLVSWQEVS